MRRLPAACCSLALAGALLTAAAPVGAQDRDAFFTLVNTYAYTDGPREGRRHLLEARQTFSVVGRTLDNEDTVWYRVVFPQRTTTLQGSGWVPHDPQELSERRDGAVLVFPRILKAGDAPVEALEIPAGDLALANVTQPSESFPELTWQKVNYETEKPLELWARGPTGIYRPTKSPQFLSETYAEMVTRGVETDRLRRLLSGVVRVGDTPQEVQWALGPPSHKEQSSAEDMQIVIWHYPGLQIRFEDQVVKQIN